MQQDEHGYSPGDDGLLVQHVGRWAKDKLKILADYVQASGATRRKFLGSGAAYIDVFSGPGRSRIRETGEYIDGSPVVAFKQGQKSLAPFTSIEISDADETLQSAAESRLRSLNAPVRATPGPATMAMEQIVAKLNPYGLHFAFLDPHNLGALSFSLFESLARLRSIDVLVHVSLQDLRRNVDRYSAEDYDQFDVFAPGWRENVNVDQHPRPLRASILKFWFSKVEALGLLRAEHYEPIRASKSQELYWLVFLSKRTFAHSLWNKITSIHKQPRFSFDE